MMIQAMPILPVNNCTGQSLTASALYPITYSVKGSVMISGTLSPVLLDGTVYPGSYVSESITGAPPFSISVGFSGVTAKGVVTSPNAIVTYVRFGPFGNPTFPPLLVIRDPSPTQATPKE